MRFIDPNKKFAVFRHELVVCSVAQVVVLACKVPSRAVDRPAGGVARHAGMEHARRHLVVLRIRRSGNTSRRFAVVRIQRRVVRALARAVIRKSPRRDRRHLLDARDPNLLRIGDAVFGLMRHARALGATRLVALAGPALVVADHVLHLVRGQAYRDLEHRAARRAVPLLVACVAHSFLAVRREIDASAQ